MKNQNRMQNVKDPSSIGEAASKKYDDTSFKEPSFFEKI